MNWRGAALSWLAHAAVLAVLMWSGSARVPAARGVSQDIPLESLVWITIPGPAGGGGGRPAPVPTPTQPPPPQAVSTLDTPIPPPEMIPLNPVFQEPLEPQPPVPATTAPAPMAGTALPSAAVTGNGSGTGSGDGTGGGAGPGRDRGFGGDAYRPGNGVTTPVPLHRAVPQYTVEAMRAHAHGTITVECVVEPHGACGAVRIIRAFAPPYGLDRQALEAARRWQFRPGTREGVAVPVLVSLEIAFNIH